MSGTTTTASPVMNPERAGVVKRSPKVWSAKPVNMARPSNPPSRKSPGVGRCRRTSQSAPRTAVASPKRSDEEDARARPGVEDALHEREGRSPDEREQEQCEVGHGGGVVAEGAPVD